MKGGNIMLSETFWRQCELETDEQETNFHKTKIIGDAENRKE